MLNENLSFKSSNNAKALLSCNFHHVISLYGSFSTKHFENGEGETGACIKMMEKSNFIITANIST